MRQMTSVQALMILRLCEKGPGSVLGDETLVASSGVRFDYQV